MIIQSSLTIKHRDVDAVTPVVWLEVYLLSCVEEIRVEDDGAILAIRYADYTGMVRVEKVAYKIAAFVVSRKVPRQGCINVVDQHSARRVIQIRFIRRYPKVHVYRGEIGVDRRVRGKGAGVLEAP